MVASRRAQFRPLARLCLIIALVIIPLTVHIQFVHAATSVLLNEIDVNPPGADPPNEYVELKGKPGELLSGLYLVAIEGNNKAIVPSGNETGIARTVVPLGAQTIGTTGLLVISGVGNKFTFNVSTTVVLDPQFTYNDALGNNSLSVLLVSNAKTAPVVGTDYDANDDGALELPAGSTIIDSVGWKDNNETNTAKDIVYSAAVLTQKIGAPDAATRFEDNTAPQTSSAWYNGELNGDTLYNPAQASTNLPVGAQLTPGNVNKVGDNLIIPACVSQLTTTSGKGLAVQVSARYLKGRITAIEAIETSKAAKVRAGILLTNKVTSPINTKGVTATATLSIAPYTDPTDANGDNFIVRFTTDDKPPQTTDCQINAKISQSSTYINTIQGASHTSPLLNATVDNITGIVTFKTANGFYMQDSVHDDGKLATSEGIFVRTGTTSTPAVKVGDSVIADGVVLEVTPGGSGGSNNLSTTTISVTNGVDNDKLPVNGVTILTHNNPLPAPTVIGTGGRVPPQQVIEDDVSGDAQTNGTFDPDQDGLDFYESLEGMLVQVNNAVVVGPTSVFSAGTASENREIVVVGDNGANAGTRSARGGVVAAANDFNPERIFLSDTLSRPSGVLPLVNVGDHLTSEITGTIDYSFGNFKLDVLKAPTATSGNLAREVTAAASQNQVSVATFNLENLDPTDPQAKFDQLAGLIVTNLQAPDIVAVEEIQDNNGPTNNGTVDASTTYTQLVAAIAAKGGPTYQFRDIAPVNNQDGGEPGGNIRQGFLFRTDRGLAFVDRAGGSATSAVTVAGTPGNPELSASPGRIEPANAAFTNSRKPLAGEFIYGNAKLFVIANHFNSKSGDLPLFGRIQPPTRSSETQRAQQAQVVGSFVGGILSRDPNANVIVLGDLNDFEFSGTLSILKASGLTDLVETLPQPERYTYVFEGNSETLDHILVSSHLATGSAIDYDILHVNAEFADQASDHDPQVVRLSPPSPTLALSGPATVNVDAGTATISITLSSAAVVTTSVDYTITSDAAITVNKVIASGTLTFGPGETTKAVTVPLTDVKPGEKLTLTLSNPQGAALSGNASITLTVVETQQPVAQFKIFLPVVRK